MGMQDHDISSIQTQLTVARWHLDASICATLDAVRQHRRRAWHAYESALQTFSRLDLAPAEREALEQELAALQQRMNAIGDSI